MNQFEDRGLEKNSYRFYIRYNIGDIVYYNAPDGDRGIIIDISFSCRYNSIKYEVVFGREASDNVWCVEEELTNSKVF
jgi:hypothetical protein